MWPWGCPRVAWMGGLFVVLEVGQRETGCQTNADREAECECGRKGGQGGQSRLWIVLYGGNEIACVM